MPNRILIVEDEKAIADGIAVNLQYAGYDYLVFDDGQQTADYLNQDHSFDMALLDIMLPGLNGFELFGFLEKYSIPVIYITAKSESVSEIKGLRSGAEDYIVKPFDMMTLLVRIEKVLERTGTLNKVLRFRDITINTENRSVMHCGNEIVLKPLEFDVLAMLVRYKNRTITRERLLNELWGTDFFGGSRTVDVHIANIRRKLALHDDIKTVSKTGYRLEE